MRGPARIPCTAMQANTSLESTATLAECRTFRQKALVCEMRTSCYPTSALVTPRNFWTLDLCPAYC
eukprot:10910017-Prorocentrum_lima.AAC.1